KKLTLHITKLKKKLNNTNKTTNQNTPLNQKNILTKHKNKIKSTQPNTIILHTSKINNR
ncbi:DNA-packaging protein FI, partial [Klebsiella pneumoniae]|uniref:DNA-packaging protein FI n=1 Tax=Klebsiella pneumoniae TaxID=573 RepID=UPI003B5BAC5F